MKIIENNNNDDINKYDNINKIKKNNTWDYSHKLWICFTQNVIATIIIDFDILENKYKNLLKKLIKKNMLFVYKEKYENNLWIEPISLLSVFSNTKNILIKNIKINKINQIIELLKEFVECKIINKCKIKKLIIKIDINNEQRTIIKQNNKKCIDWIFNYCSSQKQITVKRH